ncbi:MAG: exodeoxyribonuclease V subunit gamma [Nitrospirales bacterium]
MFTLLSGPFHPHLESALVEMVQQIKAADPATPLAIIVPSESLRRRVQWLLCVEHSCALFDLHVLTFHQFALHLHTERQGLSSPEAQASPLDLVGDFFYEYLLGILLEQGGSSVGPFAHLEGSSGLRQALWRSLRDLQEAQVEPSLASRAVEEGLFDQIATNRLQGLLGLQSALTALSRQLGVGLPEDLANSVIPWVASSPFIARLSTIIYYGFYDITQVQLSLLEEVARISSVKVFFPLGDQPAYRFAQRFVERHLLKAGVVHQSIQVTHESFRMRNQASSPAAVQVVNVIGGQGELSFTCKAILHAVETTGHAFFEIGVVARNLEPYIPFLRRVFDEHQIPFFTAATAPLLEEPVAKVWWQLAGLREEQYPWRSLLDVVTSPCYRGLSVHGPLPHEQGHLWSRAVRHFRIVRGREDWERLVAAANDPALMRDWGRKNGVSLEEASAVIQQLAEVVGRLIADCQAVPESGSIGELTKAFERLVNAHLCLSGGLTSSQPDGREDASLTSLADGFEQVMTLMKQLDRVGAQVTWGTWVNLFRRALETTRRSIPGQSPLGVQVFDAMAARGHAFRTVFLLGMNDQVFPRVVREDAFLRDRDRKVLAESLGYKIDEKINGFEEESLLFALLRQSARDRVYLVYQRADHKGRPLLPSSLLLDCVDEGQACSGSEISVPLHLAERVTVPYCAPGGETLQETRLRYLLQGRLIQADSSEPFFWWQMFDHGRNAVPSLERSHTGAGPFDGIIAGAGAHWQDLLSRGLSPTALEHYAQCPFRYWMEHVLGTRNFREPPSREIPSRAWGELGHAILRRVYQHLVDLGWPVSHMEDVQLSSLVTSDIEQVSLAYAGQYGKGYVVLWEEMKAQLTRVVLAMIEQDQRQYSAQGMVPVAFEVEAEGMVPSGVPGSFPLIKIHGRLDRVDRQSHDSRIRIVDYKFTGRSAIRTGEPDLVGEALQGRRLQPPLYSFMSYMHLTPSSGEQTLPNPSIHSIEFRYVRPLNTEPLGFTSFASSIWETATGDLLLGTIHRLIRGIRAGQFFVLPGNYCRECHWSVSCRFQHHPSWVRAHGLPLAKEFRQMRKQRAKHE